MIVKILSVVGYLGVLLLIGVVASRRMRDVRDYYAAGKGLGFWTVAFSSRATGESAWLLLGLTGMGAAVGLKAFWIVLAETLGVTGAWLLMSRRFKRLTDDYDSITIPDYLESRFRDDTQILRIVAAFALTVFVTIYVSAQIDATGKAFEDFLGWNYFVGIAVGFVVVIIYIVSGGFLAVAWSDVFQGSLMFLGLVTLPIVGLVAAGGWGNVTSELAAADPALMSWTGTTAPLDVTTVLSLVGLLALGVGFMGSPQVFVRFIALRDERELASGAFVAIAFTLLTDAGAVLVGMIGRAVLLDPGGDFGGVLGSGGENVLPLLVDHVMPLIIVGIYVAIVLSAIMSTIDSLLVVASSAAVRDYYQQVRYPDLPDDSLVGISRGVTFVLAVIALAIAVSVALITPDRTVFWFVVFGWSGISATFCPTIILSLFWRGFTRDGALTAMIAGFASVPIFKFGAPALPVVGDYFAALGEMAPALLVSALVGITVSLVDPAGLVRLKNVELP